MTYCRTCACDHPDDDQEYIITENELRRYENAIDFYDRTMGVAIRSRKHNRKEERDKVLDEVKEKVNEKFDSWYMWGTRDIIKEIIEKLQQQAGEP